MPEKENEQPKNTFREELAKKKKKAEDLANQAAQNDELSAAQKAGDMIKYDLPALSKIMTSLQDGVEEHYDELHKALDFKLSFMLGRPHAIYHINMPGKPKQPGHDISGQKMTQRSFALYKVQDGVLMVRIGKFGPSHQHIEFYPTTQINCVSAVLEGKHVEEAIDEGCETCRYQNASEGVEPCKSCSFHYTASKYERLEGLGSLDGPLIPPVHGNE